MDMWWMLWLSVSLAGPEEAVQKLLDQDKADAARTRCEKSGAHLLGADQALRETCAEAWFPTAQASNTLAAYQAFSQEWKNTPAAQRAFEAEAELTLQNLGRGGTTLAYDKFLQTYGATKAGEQARAWRTEAAFSEASSAETARRLLQQHPGHPDARALVARFLPELIQLHIDTDRPWVSTSPVVAAADAAIETRWAVKRNGDGAVLLWTDVVAEHLQALKVDNARALAAKLEAPCELDGSGWTLGARAWLDGSEAFIPVEGRPSCTPQLPGFIVSAQERVVAVSLEPGVLLHAAVGAQLSWSDRNDTAVMPLPSAAGAIRVGPEGMYQQVGAATLFVPIQGGIGMLTAAPAPAESVMLTAGSNATALPPRYRLQRSSDGTTRVAPAPLGKDWWLPEGTARVMSPLLQRASGFHVGAPALTGPARRSLPVEGDGEVVAPEGSEPIALVELDGPSRSALTEFLVKVGGPTPERAWRLTGESVQIFVARVGAAQVVGWYDAARPATSWVIADALGTPQAFRWRDHVAVGWRSPDGSQLDAVVRTPRGAWVRQVLTHSTEASE